MPQEANKILRFVPTHKSLFSNNRTKYDGTLILKGEDIMPVIVWESNTVIFGEHFLTADLTNRLLANKIFKFIKYYEEKDGKQNTDLIIMNDLDGNEVLTTKHTFDGAHVIHTMPGNLNPDIMNSIFCGEFADGDVIKGLSHDAGGNITSMYK